jgi:hypothetical protein
LLIEGLNFAAPGTALRAVIAAEVAVPANSAFPLF